MKTVFWSAVFAPLIVSLAAGAADAAKKAKPNKSAETNLQAIQLECFKQHGAWFDKERKLWVFQGSSHVVLAQRDAVDGCVKQRTGKHAPFLYENKTYR